MALPVRLELGVRDLALPVDVPVSVRVLRLEASLRIHGSGGVYAVAVPLAVVDRRSASTRWRPVVDVALVARVAVALLAASGALALRRRRRAPQPAG